MMLGLFVGLVLAEAVARVAALEARWLPDLAYYQGVDVDMHRPSSVPGLLYELRPGAVASIPAEEAEGVEDEHAWWTDPRIIEVNELGHRGPERTPAKPPGVYRILALGGSNTFGAAVSNGESWPGALERSLAAQTGRKVEVWNLGVNGYVTAQKLTQARDALRRFAPDLLLFQLYNTGPRNILLSKEVDVVAAFHDAPSLYRETLLWSPSESEKIRSWLWGRAHLYRAIVLALNRRARVDEQGKFGAPHELLDLRSERRAAEEFSIFVRDEAGEVPVWILFGAEGPGPAWCEDIGVPVIELEREPDIPDLPGARHIHPGADVYSWYGEKIAEKLVEAGCLDEGC
jgi:hypothetical protein